jgi:hypothetical protein
MRKRYFIARRGCGSHKKPILRTDMDMREGMIFLMSSSVQRVGATEEAGGEREVMKNQ